MFRVTVTWFKLRIKPTNANTYNSSSFFRKFRSNMRYKCVYYVLCCTCETRSSGRIRTRNGNVLSVYNQSCRNRNTVNDFQAGVFCFSLFYITDISAHVYLPPERWHFTLLLVFYYVFIIHNHLSVLNEHFYLLFYCFLLNNNVLSIYLNKPNLFH